MADPHTRTPNSFVVFAGSAAVLAIVIVVVACSLSTGKKEDVVDKKRADQRIAAREALDKAANEQLTTVDWADKAKGVVRLPVADAMKLVAVELKARKPAPSQVKIEPTLPMPPPYDPASTEPPVSALTSSPQGADTIRFDPPAPAVTNPAPATGSPASAPTAPAPAGGSQPPAAPAQAPAPSSPAAAPSAPIPAAPAPAPAPTAPIPAPSEPVPAPPAPAPAPPVPPPAAPSANILTSSAAPNRPPLIHWTEPSTK